MGMTLDLFLALLAIVNEPGVALERETFFEPVLEIRPESRTFRHHSLSVLDDQRIGEYLVVRIDGIEFVIDPVGELRRGRSEKWKVRDRVQPAVAERRILEIPGID